MEYGRWMAGLFYGSAYFGVDRRERECLEYCTFILYVSKEEN
jgi:hypothetical protein